MKQAIGCLMLKVVMFEANVRRWPMAVAGVSCVAVWLRAGLSRNGLWLAVAAVVAVLIPAAGALGGMKLPYGRPSLRYYTAAELNAIEATMSGGGVLGFTTFGTKCRLCPKQHQLTWLDSACLQS